MSLKEMASGRKDLFMLDPRLLVVEPGWNVREPGPELEEHIQTLMASIAEIGIQEPLTIYMRGEEPVITNGHCRYTAVMRLIANGTDIKAVPVRVEERYASEADRILSMLTRNAGKPLTPLEKGMVFKRLLGHGWKVEEIAKKSGVTPEYASRLLTLTAAPSPVINMVRNNQVSATTAVETLKDLGEEKATEVLQGALAVATSEGKAKATPKHIERHRAASSGDETEAKPIKWGKVGPELAKLIWEISKASGKDRSDVIARAVAYVEENCP